MVERESIRHKGLSDHCSISDDFKDNEQDKPCKTMGEKCSKEHKGQSGEVCTLGKGGIHADSTDSISVDDKVPIRIEKEGIISKGNDSIEDMFNVFWKEYPSNCPRKVDKKKCRDKFARIFAAIYV